MKHVRPQMANRTIRRGSLCLSILLCALLVSCAGGGKNSPPSPTPASNPTVQSITVAPSSSSIVVGATQQFTATAKYSDNSTKDVTGTASWSSSSSSVATVSAAGVAIGLAAGKSTITATLSGANATATLTIAPSLQSITVTPASSTAAPGSTLQLSATGTYSDGTTQDLTASATWSSNTTSVATVNSSGLVTLVVAGTATVAASEGSVTGSATITVQPLGVSSISNNSPLPLTPVSIGTTGLDVSSPVTVQFADTTGFSTTENPIRVAADGTIVAAVPLYVDATGTPISGPVSMTVTQGNTTTGPVTVTIQNLPAVASYGVQPGEISHAMFILQALMLSQRINALQALQGAQGNQVNSTTSQTSLQQLLTATIEARSDVDRVLVNNSIVIPAATLSNGTQLTFDASALDMMDRVQAIFLMQTFGDVVLQTQSNAASSQERLYVSGHRIPNQKKKKTLSLGYGSVQPNSRRLLFPSTPEKLTSPSPETKLGQILLAIQALNTAGQISLQTIRALDPKTVSGAIGGDPNAILDQVSAIGAGLDAVGKWLPSETLFSSITGLLSVSNTIVHAITNDACYIYAEATGDTATAAIIVQDMAQNVTKDVDALVAIAPLVPVFGEAVAGASTVYGYWTTGRDYYCLATNNASSVCPDQADANTAQQVSQQDASVFAPPNPGLADVTGSVTINSNLGIQSPDGGIEVSPGPGGQDIDALADPSGFFQMYVPLGVTSFNYAASDFSLYDPIAGTVLSSETVDLSQAGSSTPVVIPTLTGTCIDDDIDDPDGDDPDCDSN